MSRLFEMSRNLLPKHVAAVVKYQKDPHSALQMFNSAKEDGFKHQLSTYKCMIDKLGSHGEFEAMEAVLADMRINIDNSNSLEGVYISAMKNYGKKHKIQEAVNVFERMEFYSCEPSVQSYNAIMNVLVQLGYFDQAHKVYMRMIDKGIAPDVYTFTIRIKAFCRTRRPFVALRLLKNMPSQGCEFNSVAYCTVIGGLYEEDCKIDARELFDEMLRREIFPEIATFNKLIHVLCKKGGVHESLSLFNKVFKRAVSPNLFTFNILIQGFCNKGMLNEAARMLDNITSEGLTADVVTYNTLICGLCKHFKVADAEFYLHQMVNKGCEPDYFTYNTIVDGYCKMGLVENAEKILKYATFKNFVPDEFTYCALIYGFCKVADIDRAITILREVKKANLNTSIILYNTLIKGLSQQGLILQALEIMTEMSEIGCNPDTWTYNIIINGLCKMGCVSDAKNLITEAMEKECLPDIFTFNTLIDGYCKQLKINNAIEIINMMWEHDVSPDAITYNTVLNGLCKTARAEEVMETLKAMKEKGFVPNVITYNILIESFCKVKNIDGAMSLLEEMEKSGCTPDIVSFGTLIHGLCEHKDLDEAYRLFRKTESHYKIRHTTSTYNIMIKAFSEKLKIDLAVKLFREMGDNGFAPDDYTYRCMIDGYCRTGNIDSAYKYLLEEMEMFLPVLSTLGRVMNFLCTKNRVIDALRIIHLMVQKGIVPDSVNAIFEVDKKKAAAPKIVVEDLLKKSHITYDTYELLYDGVRDKNLSKNMTNQKLPRNLNQQSR